MSLVVQKFGGSSLETADKLRSAAERIVAEAEKGNDTVVVVSAQGDRTDELIGLAREIDPDPDPRELDMLMAVGEQMSIALTAIAIHRLGHDAVSLTGAQAGIRTDATSSKARIKSVDTSRIRRELDNDRIVIVAGFQGVDRNDNITTLGRGGSDTTAVALAVSLGADRCDIFTDVDGIHTGDPRIVSDARKLDSLDFEELLELASMGAGVMHSRAVEIAERFNQPFRVRPSFKDSEGSLVKNIEEEVEQVDVRGAALEENEAKLTVRNVPDRPGIASTIFHRISEHGINVDMIVQNVSEHGATDLSFTVDRDELPRAVEVLEELSDELDAGAVEADRDISKLSVVGVGMRSHHGVAEKMFHALAEDEVNIEMISTSEIKISCIISAEDGHEALRAVHDAFELSEED